MKDGDSESLARAIAAQLPNDGVAEILPGLWLVRASTPGVRFYNVLQPCLCVIAQGAKDIQLGRDGYHYDPLHYLLATAGLPVAGHITEASAERPYLGLRLDLDTATVNEVLLEAGGVGARGADARSLDVSPLNADLLDAVVRLVRLGGHARDARVLRPLILREIVYRLLVGRQGARLRQIATLGGERHRIAEAAERLAAGFAESINMVDLAAEFGMSASTFYARFRACTGLTPLNYQKAVRLREARRLLLGGEHDAAEVTYRVGYGDPSHFSREYKRAFGITPGREAQRAAGYSG